MGIEPPRTVMWGYKHTQRQPSTGMIGRNGEWSGGSANEQEGPVIIVRARQWSGGSGNDRHLSVTTAVEGNDTIFPMMYHSWHAPASSPLAIALQPFHHRAPTSEIILWRKNWIFWRICTLLASPKRYPKSGLMLSHRLRQWDNIKPALIQHLELRTESR